MRAAVLVTAAAAAGVAGCVGGHAARGGVGAEEAAAAVYEVLVANESSDVVSRVAFAPGRGARVVDTVAVGVMPADVDGPHGLAVSPDGRHWYVTLAHGTPYGTVWKFEAGSAEPVGRAELGRFAATAAVSPDGEFVYVANFNLHGDPVPSGVSVVHAPTMTEVARPTTCTMPHGSRFNTSGTRHYSVCMHDDQLVELDTRTLRVSGRFSVAPGREGPLPLEDEGGAGHHAAAVCSPTWAEPARGAGADRYVYVTCNRSGEVLEVDVRTWRVARRFRTGGGPYNLAAAPDGRTLLATLKGGQAVAVIALETGEVAARIPTSRPVTHGVAVSPDGRYAFVTNEAVGSTPGTLDVLDVEARGRVASVELRHQPGGVDVWRAQAPAR